ICSHAGLEWRGSSCAYHSRGQHPQRGLHDSRSDRHGCHAEVWCDRSSPILADRRHALRGAGHLANDAKGRLGSLAHLQHAVDHLTGDTEIVRRIDQFFQFLAVSVFADLLVFSEQVDEGTPSFYDFTTYIVDEVVRLVAPKIRTEPHHYRFRHDQSFGDIEILTHFLFIDLQSLDQKTRLREGPC